ncbi:OmpA family protein, partial [Pseudomonas aeruginosa]|uniref:OmpA family protein n=1 Tax=Pseudomonas aeruginosa TaxID=287 RepID=UPI0024B87487
TDNTGAEGYNQKLSERRAESVAAVFREAGMPAANIEVRGLGMSKPVADNKTRAGRDGGRVAGYSSSRRDGAARQETP